MYSHGVKTVMLMRAGRRLFFTAAMEEMSGKETQLATDPECSIVLERMIYSMDDFARRVLADRFSGSYVSLSLCVLVC